MKRPKYIISPHCDDALLALGGLITQWRSEDVTVLTLFGTCAWTIGSSMSAVEITKINREEEVSALKKAGCRSKLLDYEEALLRGYTEWNEMPKTSDNELLHQLTATLQERVLKGAEIYIPLAVGGHTDHLLTRQAAIANIDYWLENDCVVYFYEDLPYSWYDDPAGVIEGLPFALSPVSYDISAQLSKKIELVKLYKSQVGTDEIAKVKEYAATITPGAFQERIWRIQK